MIHNASTTRSRDRTVGVIGLGVMGAPMAGHLLRERPELHVLVHSRRRESAAELEQAGAEWRDSPRAMAREAGVILAMVPDLPDIRALLLAADGILDAASGPTTLVVHSTCSPDGLRELQAECERLAGPDAVRLVDAPVSGGEDGAKAGTLSIMLGGDPADLDRIEPVVTAYGQCTRFGTLGAGEVAKACNQIVVAGTIVSLAEAAVLAEGAGLDVDAVFGALSRGYAASRILDSKRTRFVEHDHSPSGAARFMVKDLRVALDGLASTAARTAHVGSLLDAFEEITARGWGDLDTAVVQALIADREERRGPH